MGEPASNADGVLPSVMLVVVVIVCPFVVRCRSKMTAKTANNELRLGQRESGLTTGKDGMGGSLVQVSLRSHRAVIVIEQFQSG